MLGAVALVRQAQLRRIRFRLQLLRCLRRAQQTMPLPSVRQRQIATLTLKQANLLEAGQEVLQASAALQVLAALALAFLSLLALQPHHLLQPLPLVLRPAQVSSRSCSRPCEDSWLARGLTCAWKALMAAAAAIAAQ